MKIKWTQTAKDRLDDIFDFYKYQAGSNVAKKVTKGIVKSTLNLRQFPFIGQIEELLENSEIEFRYRLYQNYKIIYWVNETESRIEITDLFDTRQNPERLEGKN